MARSELLRHIPDAPGALIVILDAGRGPVQSPIRSEIFGSTRFAQHGQSLGDTHRANRSNSYAATFFPQLKSNIRVLREAHDYIGIQASTGYDISPAAEWLLDNFHTIEAQLKEIHEGLPRSYFRTLPILLDEPLAGLPRIYGVGWAFVAHTDGAFDEDLLQDYLGAYQERRELNLSELWALPTTLRVVLIENLRRLAERVATNKAAREIANLCFDRIENYSAIDLDQLLAQLNQRGVGMVFLVQMAHRLQDQRITGEEAEHTVFKNWLPTVLHDLAAVQIQQAADQAADNLSVSNAVMSLRAIGDADWPEIIAQTSSLMKLLLTSAVFAAEDATTRDQTLHAIEKLARQSSHSEVSVATILLALMNQPAHQGGVKSVAHHWLRGSGQPDLLQQLGLSGRMALAWQFVSRRVALPFYLCTLMGAVFFIVWVLLRLETTLPGSAHSGWMFWCMALLAMFPASEAAVAVINRLISESARPQHLPRLALADGIPVEHRVMVVVPCMLTSTASPQELVHRLLLHYLANPEPQAQFALLSDWADADTPSMASDDDLLGRVTQLVCELNLKYPPTATDLAQTPRFIVLHRQRHFSPTEQRWIGWERKRGKLELLIETLAKGLGHAFLDLGAQSRIASDIKYIVTLDSDTQLPPGRLRELVGVAAHPHNQPRFDADSGAIIGGYSIFQPRIATPLPAIKDFTLYHWLFAGQCGIDPYSAASSEVYQDLFGEGTFTGKGLLNVQAMYTLLAGQLPQGQVLSHDLLEGSIARCATVTDITVIEESPFHADVAASRIHRWTRGDWQLLPFLLPPKRSHLRSAINRWKILDNLRRSLVAPMSLALLLLALLSNVVSPWAALVLVMAAFSAGPLMGALAGFSPGRYGVAKLHFYREAAIDLVRALWGGLWLLAQLLQQSMLALDAIGRALYRMVISRRHLLQWTTAAVAQTQSKTELAALARQHWKEPLVALLMLAGVLATTPQMPVLAFTLCLLWAASPVWTWWVSRACPTCDDAPLKAADLAYLEGIARDTWRLFERCVGPQDNYLPPDNLQTSPHDMVAHRTSPTNMGLYLLSAACARQFGWIGTQELLERLEATLATLRTLQRHQGHFLNWYDTQTCAPLLPMYVSTVDSGNFSGHLLAVAHACLELAQAPYEDHSSKRAIHALRRRLEPLMASRGSLPPAKRDELKWLLADHRATLRSARRDEIAQSAIDTLGAVFAGTEASLRLQALSQNFEALAWQSDFRFLYNRKRNLLHIGYRVTEQQCDAGFYDLLASESRLTSLLAIAKGDVPVRHWTSLGRPFFAVGAQAALRSWSGSMFEYLMPSLVCNEPFGSVLHEACNAALHEQITFAKTQGVPWGISESAYAASDHSLAYQYAPQGVPRLALRRTPPDELVIAPYATALAAQLSPGRAMQNFAALEHLGARGHYGFIEALDFSPARRVGAESYSPVLTFMAHHQAMSIVALANVLLDGVAQRWGKANANTEAVSSLLHERVPREISILHALPMAPLLHSQRRRSPGLLCEVLPGTVAINPTQVLSNGRYSVSIRANGAGCSNWGRTGITRRRDDALRDDYGSFLFVRRPHDDDESIASQVVSITQHPAPDPNAHYQCVHHADRVCLNATWVDLQTQMTVWVSPEDDIEFRQVDLRNVSDSTLTIELLSSFEVTLIEPRADEAHPAFTNLFISSEWLATQQSLLFERKPRLPTEKSLKIAHFVTDIGAQIISIELATDRQLWQGRNHASNRLAARVAPVSTVSNDQAIKLDTGLDPVCTLAVKLRIAAHSKARLTFATAATDNSETLRAVIDKYRQHSHVERSSLMSATLTGIRLRAMRISAENFFAVQSLTTAIVLSLTRAQTHTVQPDSVASEVCDKRLLWRFGISGDKPILLVSAGVTQGLGLLRSLSQALNLWSWGGIECDLVVVNSEPSSYFMSLTREIAALRDRHIQDNAANAGGASTGFYLLRADELSNDELSTLHSLARLRLHADGRPLLHHVQEWAELHEQALEQRLNISTTPLVTTANSTEAVRRTEGSFAAPSGEFCFKVGAHLRPTRPWINVLSNPEFGAQLSEAGGGYTWAINSRLNQLTTWSNDPVADTPSEWFLFQNRKTKEVWSASPIAGVDSTLSYEVSHGQGYSVISHTRDNIGITVTWCVDSKTSVKQIQVRIENHGKSSQHLRLIGIAEWLMGAYRTDRNTLRTSLFRQRMPLRQAMDTDAGTVIDQKVTALLCTQRESSAGFGGGTAFLAIVSASSEIEDWTCDRRGIFDASGQLIVPDHFEQISGDGLDPCSALSTRIYLNAGETVERVFLLGYAGSVDAARQLVTVSATLSAKQRLEQVRRTWDILLNATTVKTPDPLFDALVNRWLLYQSVSCRMWAKAGFYQAGGATGFRDQLQDAMALAWAAPEMLRQQIILCASRQFVQGDVQHWWHAPRGAGVRTHFSDDLLWLAYAGSHYLRITGDTSLLDQQVPFLEGTAIAPGAEDAYYTPTVSPQEASVYEHAARAIDHSLRVGAHGLPLMGSGDWNDGMNRVGAQGRGESVWLGWFLCQIVAEFSPVAIERGEAARAQRWQTAAQGWKVSLNSHGWDGEWFRRAYFDEGEVLGSQGNKEARIDLIAQAWSVLSNAAPLSLQNLAMQAVESHLVDKELGVIKLLDPPLAHATPSAGYIQAYPPGVRENGGQYSHAGIWGLMAQAQLSRNYQDPIGKDIVYRYFTYLSPAHRSCHPVYGAAYGLEPYVMAGDVYTQPPYRGRGGWSWYTGAAAWMHRAAIESIFGVKQGVQCLSFQPCLPSQWQQAELTLVRDDRKMRFILLQITPKEAMKKLDQWNAVLLLPDQLLHWTSLMPETCFVIPLLNEKSS